MKKILYSMLCVLFGAATGFGQTRTMGTLMMNPNEVADGYTLIAPMFGPNHSTYLINNCGDTVHSWATTLPAGLSAELLPNGNLLRPGVGGVSTIQGGGYGGVVQIFDWAGNLVWDYTYATDNHRQHHDIVPLPNGNVLMLSWELKDAATSINNGRNPANLTNNQIWSEKLVEVQPTGLNTGNIVWEWDMFDHLVQDFDATKLNYDTVANHPELLDINYLGWSNGQKDWLHANAIDYNAALDEIVISCRHMHEFYIIDHSTTIAEAASHSGGARGKGGDILYRYGNPAVYRRGTTSDQVLWGQHHVHWIADSLVDGGKIMVFNNGNSVAGYDHSSVDIINPVATTPGDYTIDAVNPFQPMAAEWTYEDTVPTNFFATHISSAERLPNGNTLICAGTWGRIFEINPQKEKVWEYMNPCSLSGIKNQGDTLAPYFISGTENWLFRAIKYDPSYSGLVGALTPGAPIEGSPWTSICDIANVVTEPMDTIKCIGANASFNTEVYFATAYQWQVDNGTGFADITSGGAYSGENDDTLKINDVTGLNTYKYRLISSGATPADNDTSAIVTLTVNNPPAVTYSQSLTSVCQNSGLIALDNNIPAGGTFNGTAVSGTNFDPTSLSAGSYVITYNYSDGICSNQATDTITVNATPAVSFIQPTTTACNDTRLVALGGTNPAGGTYSGLGVKNTNFEPTTAGIGQHIITYTYSDGTCSNIATDTIAVSICTGINDIAKNSFSIYPNPNSGVFTINIANNENKFLFIYNSIGKLVKEIRITSQEQLIDLTDLTAGIYMARLESTLVRLVIQK